MSSLYRVQDSVRSRPDHRLRFHIAALRCKTSAAPDVLRQIAHTAIQPKWAKALLAAIALRC